MRSRLFRAALWLLPAAFRQRFGEELVATAAAVDRAKPLTPASMPRALADAVVTIREIRREIRDEAVTPIFTARRVSMSAWFEDFWQDVRVSIRGLRREPGFTSFVIAALTLGIGANAAMFGIVDRLVLSGPRGIREPASIARVYLTVDIKGMRRVTTDGFGYITFDILRRQASSFSGVATYAGDDVVIGEGVDALPARAGYVSASLFPTLGTQPVLGRFFGDAEDSEAGAAPVAVLSYAAWRRWYGGDVSALGRTIAIGDGRYTIIGVAPEGFTGPQFGTVDLWMPMGLKSVRMGTDWRTTWTSQWLQIVGRLKPGITQAQAGNELTSLMHRTYQGNETYVRDGQVSVAGLSADESGRESADVSVVRWLFGVTLIVLTIACANVVNLLLARGVRRSREVALRFALGAQRLRLMRLLLVESLLLSFGGALGGVALAYAMGGIARKAIFSWVDWSTSPVDGRVLGASIALALVTGLVVGVLPAWRAVRASVTDRMKQGARDGGGHRSRIRHALTIAQASLSVVLLVGAGLFMRSLYRVWTLPLGMDPDRVAVIEIPRTGLARIADPAAREVERTRRRQVSLEQVDAVRRLSGVEHASVAVGMPFGNRFTVEVRIPGFQSTPKLSTGTPSVSAVGPDYFATMGTGIVRGRAFGPEDRQGSEPVVIVNQTMADTIWPKQDPIGKCFYSGGKDAPCFRIVGIAQATHQTALRESPSMHYYIPFGQEVNFGGTVLLARGTGDPTALADAIRRAVLGADPTSRYATVTTVQDAIDPQTKQWRVGATVFGLAGLLALLVAAMGIYSVMSYLVADRTHEIGVRLALGARRSDVTRLILQTSVGMAVAGAAGGCLLALLSSSRVADLLFETSPRDPLVYGAAAAVIVLGALVAGIVPSVRANRISPLEALRAD
jgi:predicted permease